MPHHEGDVEVDLDDRDEDAVSAPRPFLPPIAPPVVEERTAPMPRITDTQVIRLERARQQARRVAHGTLPSESMTQVTSTWARPAALTVPVEAMSPRRVLMTTTVGSGLMAMGVWVALGLTITWGWAPRTVQEALPPILGVAIGIFGLWVMAHVSDVADRLWRTILGFALLVMGITMLFIPGPGLVTIGAGLYVLSRQYAWADALYQRLADRLDDAKELARTRVAAARSRSADTGRANRTSPRSRHDDHDRDERVAS